ncbi:MULTISPECIES: hypothetical protein [Acetobacteraceae]|uniref:hypothetical protein n=1 Tax=Acetobacteraceae TaxID=433 RepID=UPI0012B9ECB1|nr:MULTISPECIES: hypothetical protein [Acetobacteraceae]MCL1513117.1 hypothetical protein [Parasaccharibacter sp. TMW 2.1891]MPW00617.1 hypothetical protein [Bombella apis]
MDIEQIEQSYTQFRNTAQQAFQLIDRLIGQMQDASQNGDAQAGEWAASLQQISSIFQNGQGHAGDLVGQLAGLVSHLGEKNGGESSGEQGSGFASFGKALQQDVIQEIGGNLLSKFFR